MTEVDPRVAAAGLLRQCADSPEETRYDILVADAYVALENARIHTEKESFDFYFQAEADVSSRLAIAEQQHIANLIALALAQDEDHLLERTSLLEQAAERLGQTNG